MERYKGLVTYRDDVKPVYTVCGDDCSCCPRYLAKTDDELHRTAEFWHKIGWRDHVVSNNEIACTGCCTKNNCRYQLLRCTKEHNVMRCKECAQYPCDKIANMLSSSDQKEVECREHLSPEEFSYFKRAFYQKKKNIER